jgi:uncharacterized protein YecT (DUF1311 family)
MAALLAVAPAVPAAAQDALVFDIGATAACVAGGGGRDCIGLASAACMQVGPGGTTAGISGCLERELDWWDARLNAAYGALMARDRAADAEMKRLGAAAPSQAEALRAMQRAWIAWRDTTCDYERAQWGGGTGGGPATHACLVQRTGEQALYLETTLAHAN